jgi:hypothetical protein
MKTENQNQSGFTRVDLVAVVTMVAVLGALTLPLRGDAASESAGVICRVNKRQLIRALHLYTMDNGGLLPPNTGDPTSGRTWVFPVIGFDAGATNSAALTNPTTSLLANYLERNSRPFKCPADLSTQRIGTTQVPRARSVAMSNAVGTDGSRPKEPTPGAWLDGGYGHTANRIWRCFGKLSDMVKPIPADLWVILDEHQDSINDGMFGNIGPGPQSQKRWIDWPAHYHNGAAGFGMADGSAMLHRWNVPAPNSTIVNPQPPPMPSSLSDLLWLADHTTSLITDQP